MVLIRWGGGLLAIPLRLLALALRLLGMPNHRLMRAIWFISGDEEAAIASLSPLLAENRRDEVLAVVQRWNARRPRPMLVGFAGLLLLDNGDISAARQALLEGRQMAAPDPTAMLEVLEFGIAQKDENLLAARQCAIRLEQRRDLPPTLRREILYERMMNVLMERNFEDARQRAAFLLNIQQEPLAELVLWALAARRGDDQAAAMHLNRGLLPGSPQRYYQYLAAWATQLPDVER